MYKALTYEKPLFDTVPASSKKLYTHRKDYRKTEIIGGLGYDSNVKEESKALLVDVAAKLDQLENKA